MEYNYQHYLELLETQQWYFSNLLGRRNKYSDQAMVSSISKFWDNVEDRTPLEIAYHGLEPLYQISQILEDKSLEWGDRNLELKETTTGTSDFINIYKTTLDNAKNVLEAVQFTGFSGNMSEYNDIENREKFEQRLKIFCMHAMTHLAQAIKFQGMICYEMDRSEINELE